MVARVIWSYPSIWFDEVRESKWVGSARFDTPFFGHVCNVDLIPGSVNVHASNVESANRDNTEINKTIDYFLAVAL